MKAGELAIILAHVDPDLDIHIDGAHLVSVTRKTAYHDRSARPPFPVKHSPCVQLSGGGRWWEPAPPWFIEGPFLRRPQLDAQLGQR